MEMSKFLSSMSLFRRRLRPRPRFWLLLILLMLLGFGASCALSQYRSLQAERRAGILTEEKRALTDTLRSLEARHAYAQTDAYVERIARDELNMLYPGEIRYIAN